jgi:hypothetical protein
VPVRAWNNARKGTWGLPPPVKLERRDMTYTVSMWRKTQNKQKKKNSYHWVFLLVACISKNTLKSFELFMQRISLERFLFDICTTLFFRYKFFCQVFLTQFLQEIIECLQHLYMHLHVFWFCRRNWYQLLLIWVTHFTLWKNSYFSVKNILHAVQYSCKGEGIYYVSCKSSAVHNVISLGKKFNKNVHS